MPHPISFDRTQAEQNRLLEICLSISKTGISADGQDSLVIISQDQDFRLQNCLSKEKGQCYEYWSILDMYT